VNKKQLVLAVLLCGMMILATSCLFRETGATRKLEMVFHLGEFRLPFLEVGLNGKTYQTDTQGKVILEEEPSGFLFPGPWEVGSMKKEGGRVDVHLRFADKPFVGLIFLEKDGEFLAELVSTNQERLKALEFVVEGAALTPAKNRETVETFGRTAMLVKMRGDVNVLEMDESEGTTLRKMYGVLGNSDGALAFARFAVGVENLPLRDFRITAVDGDGKVIEEMALGSLAR